MQSKKGRSYIVSCFKFTEIRRTDRNGQEMPQPLVFLCIAAAVLFEFVATEKLFRYARLAASIVLRAFFLFTAARLLVFAYPRYVDPVLRDLGIEPESLLTNALGFTFSDISACLCRFNLQAVYGQL